jgi:cytochrome c553
MRTILRPLLALVPLAMAAAASAATPERVAQCLACHGENGQSQIENVPSLGGQPAPYALVQLFLFRERLRLADPMNDQMKGLGDDDLQSLADTIAKLPPPQQSAGDKGDENRLARARALVEQQHCNSCHKADFSGQENIPRLADQREDYLLKALRDYKSGTRHGYDATMAEVLQPIDDAQIADVAYYLSRLR